MLRPYRRHTAFVVFLGLLAVLSEGVGLSLFLPFLQSFESFESSNGSSFIGLVEQLFKDFDSEQRALVIALVIVLVALTKAILSFSARCQSARLSVRIGHDLRRQTLDAAHRADFRRIVSRGTGDVLNILSNESWRATDAMLSATQLVTSALSLLVYTSLLVLIDWRLTLIAIAALGVAGLLVRHITSRAASHGRTMTAANSEVARAMVENIDGIEIVRAFGGEDRESSRFDVASERLKKASLRTEVLSAAVHPTFELLAAAILVGVLLYSVVLGGLLQTMVFALVLYRLVPVVRGLEDLRVDVNSKLAAVRAVAEFLDLNIDDRSVERGTTVTDIRDSIRLKNVSFAYDEDARPVLDSVCAEIPSRGITLLTGPSGAGKSTLARLLMRFYEPSSGVILVDGMSLATADIKSWRNCVALVPQSPFLFNASVSDNIGYGSPGCSAAEIRRAAETAGVANVIESMPKGYDTVAGDEGFGVSVGEAQRICLARALVREPSLLILDEATNALDEESEHSITAALMKLRRQCAILVIAHRGATIENSDSVIRLPSGLTQT